ncbi:MAG: hypothetical protein ABSB35_18745 [Bryobacteraceae bacterium]|jgi:hypothetical protein
MASSGFWKERQAEFLKYTDRFAEVWAKWHALSNTWQLWWGRAGAGGRAPQEAKDMLNAIAQKTIVGLPQRDGKGDGDAWELWLDVMKKSESGFRPLGSGIACTEREWDAGVKDGKSLYQVRREQKYTFGDEWEKVYRRTKSGRLRRLSARELEAKTADDLRKYYHWLQDGRIDHVFQASADFCEVLAARAFALEPKEVGHGAEAPRRPGKQKLTNDPTAGVKKIIHELKVAGHDQGEICKRLADKSRPKNAAWRHLTWPAAFKDKTFRPAVKSWISRVK